MSTIVTRAGKGSALSWTEADANFTNLNTDKYQSGDSPTFAVVTATTRVTVPDGAEATPSLKIGDEQNGFYSPAGSQLALSLGGTKFYEFHGLPSTTIYAMMGVGNTSKGVWGHNFYGTYGYTAGPNEESSFFNYGQSSTYIGHGWKFTGLNPVFTTTGTVTPARILLAGGQVSLGGATTTGTAGNTVTFVDSLTTRPATADVLLNGGRLAFPATQNASTDANTLDDYEEGTWNPVDASGAGLTFTDVNAYYTKIGRMVFVTCQLTYPVTANGSQAIIGGLPFASAAAAWSGGCVSPYTSTGVDSGWMVPTGTTTWVAFDPDGGGVKTNAQLSNATVYALTTCYFTT